MGDTRPYISTQRLLSNYKDWGLSLTDTEIHWRTLNFSWFKRIRTSPDHWASRIKREFRLEMGTNFMNRIASGPSELIGIIRLISEFWKDMAISWVRPSKAVMNLLGNLQPLNSNPTLTADNRFEFYMESYYLEDIPTNYQSPNLFVNIALNNINRNRKYPRPISPFYISLEGIVNKDIKIELLKNSAKPGQTLVDNRIARYGGNLEIRQPSTHLFKNFFLTDNEIWLRYKLATSSLHLNNQIGDNEGLCQMCNGAEETTSHLFLECPFTRPILRHTTNLIEIHYDRLLTQMEWICTTGPGQHSNEIEKLIAKTQSLIFASRCNKIPIPTNSTDAIDFELLFLLTNPSEEK